jgi:hypothetical protein
MASTAREYQIPMPPKRENLSPVSSDLRRHPQHPQPEQLPLPPAVRSPERLRGSVKWGSPQKNFCYLQLPDGRDVFLHRDDFSGEWPPRYMHTVIFELIKTGHRVCGLRAKEANTVEAEKR